MQHFDRSKKLLIANWKANKTVTESQEWLDTFRAQQLNTAVQYVLCAPYHLLSTVQPTRNDSYVLGVQDLSQFGAGAYTGEIAGANLVGLGVQYALVGHSERRKYLHETSALVALKVEAAVQAELTPVVCMDREQIEEQADQIPQHLWNKLLIAYEPVHAISTFGGQEDPIETTLEVIAHIHEVFGNEVPVLYGGSVNSENSLVYLQQETIAGALVGGASLDAEKFSQL